MLPKVAVIFTGGTISMSVDPEIGAAIPTLTGTQIMASVSNIDRLAEIITIEYAEVPSPHMTFDMLFDIRSLVLDQLDKEDISGVVITHGTDSLEESAYFFDLTIHSEKPVVLVGAMRSSSELGYDGPSNLAAGVCTVISPKAKNLGTLVVMNNEVISAKEVRKTNTLSLNTFQSPYGPIATIDANDLILHRSIQDREYYPCEKVNPQDVAVILTYLEMGPELIQAAINQKVKGIVIEAMGRGNVPPGIFPVIKEAIDSGILVIIVSRCPSGRVFESYGYLAGGKDLADHGAILAGELSGPKARIKLLLALSQSKDPSYIRKAFAKEMND